MKPLVNLKHSLYSRDNLKKKNGILYSYSVICLNKKFLVEIGLQALITPYEAMLGVNIFLHQYLLTSIYL